MLSSDCGGPSIWTMTARGPLDTSGTHLTRPGQAGVPSFVDRTHVANGCPKASKKLTAVLPQFNASWSTALNCLFEGQNQAKCSQYAGVAPGARFSLYFLLPSDQTGHAGIYAPKMRNSTILLQNSNLAKFACLCLWQLASI